MKKLSKRFAILTKLVISLVVLWLVLRNIPIQKIYSSLQTLKLNLLLFASMILAFGFLISSLRYFFIVNDEKSTRIKFNKVLKIYLIGLFFNISLPGLISGDIVRAYKIKKLGKTASFSIISLLLERFFGFFSLIVLVIFFTLYEGSLNIIPKSIKFFLYASLIISIVCLFILLTRSYRLFNKIELVRKVVSRNLDHMQLITLINIASLSLVFQLLVLVFNYLIALALNINISFAVLSGVVSLALVLSLLPISFQGLGIREGVFVYYLTMFNVGQEQAVLLGLISFALNVILGLIGGVVFLIDKD